jgi:hypothetical protein
MPPEEQVMMKRFWFGLALGGLLCACGGDKTTGEACDLGLGDYTESVCASAATAAGCESYRTSRKNDTVCSGQKAVIRTCCAYTSCDTHPSLPDPKFPSCP